MILFVEFAIGIAAIVAGFGYKHTYIVSFYYLKSAIVLRNSLVPRLSVFPCNNSTYDL